MIAKTYKARMPARTTATELTVDDLAQVAGGCRTTTYDSDPHGAGKSDTAQCDVSLPTNDHN
ncbi:MAG TPA: hypothetical protein VED40_23135 [Azospirillaceae bacterium]|nr:hypothetical protein [Azospirillaceae bacterium]